MIVSVAVVAVAAAVAVTAAALEGIVAPRYVATLYLTSVLVAFFAAWIYAIKRADGRPALGIALFVASIALFRAMNRFERPPSD